MAGTLSPWPQTRKGAKEHPVPTLQYLLRARGHTVTVDGDFGPHTDAAVREFQREKSLTVDGIAGPITWRHLLVEVRRGDQGDAVRGVQEEFRYRSGEPGQGLEIDGSYGPLTETSVRDFQAAIHADVPSMDVDGIAGPMTWQALVSGMLSF